MSLLAEASKLNLNRLAVWNRGFCAALLVRRKSVANCPNALTESAPLQDTVEIRFLEIFPNKERPTSVFPRHLVGESVAKFYVAGCALLPPLLVCLRDAPGRGEGYVPKLL